MTNAAATKRATNMASSDTDDNDLIRVMLLVGAIANVHKRKRPKLIKEIPQPTSRTHALLIPSTPCQSIKQLSSE